VRRKKSTVPTGGKQRIVQKPKNPKFGNRRRGLKKKNVCPSIRRARTRSRVRRPDQGDVSSEAVLDQSSAAELRGGERETGQVDRCEGREEKALTPDRYKLYGKAVGKGGHVLDHVIGEKKGALGNLQESRRAS